MATILEQLHTFLTAEVDYIARMNGNDALLAGALDQALAALAGLSGGALGVPLALQEIFDRRGLIGLESYDFAEGTLIGPDYNLAIDPGAYWSGGQFYRQAQASSLPMVGKTTGDYFLNLDAAGNPTVSAAADATTTRQFHWDAGTHAISAKVLYAGVAILFDGDAWIELQALQLRQAVQVLTPGAAITVDWSLGSTAEVLLDRALTTFTLTGAVDGQKCVLKCKQDGNGGRGIAVGSEVRFGTDIPSIPTLSAAGKKDYFGFDYDGNDTKYDLVAVAKGF